MMVGVSAARDEMIARHRADFARLRAALMAIDPVVVKENHPVQTLSSDRLGRKRRHPTGRFVSRQWLIGN
jgi:hypothetical protein